MSDKHDSNAGPLGTTVVAHQYNFKRKNLPSRMYDLGAMAGPTSTPVNGDLLPECYGEPDRNDDFNELLKNTEDGA